MSPRIVRLRAWPIFAYFGCVPLFAFGLMFWGDLPRFEIHFLWLYAQVGFVQWPLWRRRRV